MKKYFFVRRKGKNFQYKYFIISKFMIHKGILFINKSFRSIVEQIEFKVSYFIPGLYFLYLSHTIKKNRREK